ncbi:MAG: condensation domain-containing protein, partial [Trebonia sp.]
MLPDEIIYNFAGANVAGAARLRGRLDADILRRCLLEIVGRHEVLRTTYHAGADGRGVQHVRAVPDVPLPVADLRDIPEAEREEAARERARQEIARPFDLEHDLMLRPVLLRLADEEHLLVLCQHHVATDGWSIGVLIREVAELYSAFAAGRAPALPPLPVQYGDYAVWHREWLTGARLERQLEYWRGQLAGSRLVDVGTGLPRATTLTWDGGTLEYRMPADLWRGLTQLADSEHATPYMALLAAYSIVLARWSGQDDIVIGCPIAGRTTSEVEPLIGCFLNELPIRLNLSGEPTYRDLLRQARKVSLEAYAHQYVPFEKIVEEVNPERDAMSHAPLVRHQLGLHNEPQWRAELPGVTMELATLSTGTSRFGLEVDLSVEASGGLHGMVYYSTDLYDGAVVQRMLDRLTTVVAGAVAAGAVADPDRPFSRLPLLGAAGLRSCGAARGGRGAGRPAARRPPPPARTSTARS